MSFCSNLSVNHSSEVRLPSSHLDWFDMNHSKLIMIMINHKKVLHLLTRVKEHLHHFVFKVRRVVEAILKDSAFYLFVSFYPVLLSWSGLFSSNSTIWSVLFLT